MKKPTVTVAISAYNEEKNISAFLNSVLKQKADTFILDAIWVHSDGSGDKTVKIAKNIKSKKIRVWDHKKRVGKSTWLNKIYRDLKSDVLVQADADVILAHPFVIANLIEPLKKYSKVGMCGGNPQPLPGKSFWEKTVRNAAEPYQEFRSKVKGGHNVFSAVGQLLAFRRELVKLITVPKDMIVNDTFTYFCCLTLDWQYKFVKSAIVVYRAPQKFKDLNHQNTRFHAGYNRMFNYFPADLVKSEFTVKKWLYFVTLAKQVLKHPVLSITYYLVNLYTLYKASSLVKEMGATWSVAWTTKNLRNVIIGSEENHGD